MSTTTKHLSEEYLKGDLLYSFEKSSIPQRLATITSINVWCNCFVPFRYEEDWSICHVNASAALWTAEGGKLDCWTSVDQKHRSCLSGPPHIPAAKPGSKMISFRDLPDEKIGRRFEDQVTNPVVIHNASWWKRSACVCWSKTFGCVCFALWCRPEPNWKNWMVKRWSVTGRH